MTSLDDWIAGQARFASIAMSRAISATQTVKHRPGFGQIVIPRPGSVLASPVLAAYDPDPDYFFHWFRNSAIVMRALRVSMAEGWAGGEANDRFREFLDFSLSLRRLDGREFLRQGDFRERIEPSFLQYARSDAEIAAVSGPAVLAEARVNPDATLDISRWARPQADGPALRVLATLDWRSAVAGSDERLRAAMRDLVIGDLDFTLAYAQRPSYDIWEEESGFHYYTLLLQAEALAEGAEWLAEIGEGERSAACLAVAGAIAPRLDAFWDPDAGYYRSRFGVVSGKPGKALDAAVILAVLHAGRESGTHSVLDARAQATLTALEQLFEGEYAINRERPAGRGPALGRYAGDVYYSGGAYYFATLAAAEFYFKLAQALLAGAPMAVTEENRTFRMRMGVAGRDGFAVASAALDRGDAILRTVRAFTPQTGELSEQFDQTTGAQTSARHLAWSYAAFITAAAARRQACEAMRDAGPSQIPADAV